MDCVLAQRHLDAYVDGELSPTANLELESHVGVCEVCQAHVDFVHRLKHTLRCELRAPAAPAGLGDAIHRSLVRGEAVSRPRQVGAWASAAAAAAAACVWYMSGAPGMLPLPGVTGLQSQAGIAQQASIFGTIVERHQEQVPAEIDTPEPDRAERWFSGKLQFRVRPVAFSEPQVRFLGARLTHVGTRRAAKLYYDVGDRRLTAVAFEATPELRGLLEQRSVRVVRMGQRTVRYHSVHGYTVPIIEHNGVLYGFTGDLDERRLLRLISTVRLP